MPTKAMKKPEVSASDAEQRVLIAAPSGCDAEILCRILGDAGITSAPCTTPEDLCRQMESGAAVAILAEEFLTPAAQQQFTETLVRQPEWSDFPLIVMAAADETAHQLPRFLRELNGSAHAVRLQRPTRKFTLISSVRAALQSRIRQYQIRDELEQRKQAQLALRQSEERFRELANNIDQFAWTCDELGSATWYNQRWYDYTGTTLDDMQGWGWQKVHHPDHVDRVLEGIQHSFATGEPWEDIFPLRSKCGQYRWFLSRALPIRDEEGHVVRWFGTNTDITEQRKAEQALRESEERFSQFMQNLPGLAWIKDLEGRYVFANTACEAAFQVTRNRLYGKTDADVFSPDIAEQFRANDQDALASKSGVHVIETLEHPDGMLHHSIVSKFPISTPDGRPALVGGVAIDITDQKQAEAALKAKEAELELVAKTTPLILTRCSRDLRYLFVNRAAAELFGKESEEMVGQPIFEIMGPETFAIIKPFVERVLQGESVEYEVELPYTAAGSRWVHVNYVPDRDDEGQVQGWIASIVDVTDRKLAEAALHEADRRKDEFLAMLAHELRNPLAPIRTGLELMKMVKHEPETIEEIRGTIERQTNQLVTLVDDLLDVSRITRGKLELRKRRVTLVDVIQSAVEASQPLIADGGHDLEIRLPEQPIRIDVDPNRLAQVFSNLLNNAAKYTPDGGHIWLRAERQGSELIVSVTDNGVGIDESDLSRIFEVFAQCDQPFDQANSGLGIGLMLVKSLIEMHGGSIEARSDGLGQGSSFIVRLPDITDVPDQTQPAASMEQAKPRSSMRILVVDDNEDAAKLLARVMSLQGHEVRTAGDGQQAIDVGAAFRPDLVLMDLGMPRMDGFEAAREMRQQEWGRNITLVALSGWGQDEDKQRSKEAGFDDHLVKPLDPDELRKLCAGPVATR